MYTDDGGRHSERIDPCLAGGSPCGCRCLPRTLRAGRRTVPSVNDDLDGDEFVLVGPTVDTSKLENVLPGEGAVRIKRGVVIEAVQRYLAR